MSTLEYAAIAGVAFAAWLLLLIAALKALRAATHRECNSRRLARRADELSLLNQLSHIFAQQDQRTGIARAGAEFLVHEMGAARAVYWRPDSTGEPESPLLSVPDHEDQVKVPLLPEAQRIILARTAGRGDTPIVLERDSKDQRPRTINGSEPQDGPFVLYIPIVVGSDREGVLEIYSGTDLWDPDRWQLLGPMAAQFGAALQRARHYEYLREQADRDFVTGLYNHRFIQCYLQDIVAETQRSHSFAVLLIDVDDFKGINDTFGHSVGDRALQAIAGHLKLVTDNLGIVGRFGGDEFVIVLPEHSRQEANAFGEAFQDWLGSFKFVTPSGQRVPLRISWGLAVYPEDGGQRQELLAAADSSLYERKRPRQRSGLDRRRASPQASKGRFGFLESLVHSVDARDHYTRAHCEASAEQAVTIAQRLGLSSASQRILRLAALLHDVGKICIPDAILCKAGQLNKDEFEVIKQHVRIAEHLIVDIPNAAEVRQTARHHHERFDGSGYPDGLKGEEIPLLARILAVADTFCAITIDRAYRKGLPHEEAYAELERVAGSQLDPELVRAFRHATAPKQVAAADPIASTVA